MAPPGRIRGPPPTCCLRPDSPPPLLSPLPTRTLTLAPALSAPAATPIRRLRPPRASPSSPQAPPQAPLPSRQANRAGGAHIRRNRRRHSASGRRRRAPLLRRRPSPCLVVLAINSRVSSPCSPYPPPSFSPSVPKPHRTPPPAAATMAIGVIPATIWSHSPLPLLPSSSSSS